MDTIRPEEKIYQIFISSTYKDLISERDKAMRTIVGMGHLPIGMEDFPATDIEAFEYIKKMIDKADYYLLIIGGKYGSIHPDLCKSYTELEFDYAVANNVPVIFFLKEGITHIDYLDVDPKIKKKLDSFITKASTGRMRNTFKNVDQLEGAIVRSLNSNIKDIPRPGWIRADRVPSAVVDVQEPELDCNAVVILNYHHSADPFSLDGSDTKEYEEPKAAKWGDIIRELSTILTAPVSMYHINEILYGLCGGIDADSATKVLNTLVHYGILEVGTSSNEYTGVESYCTWTTKGFKLKAQLSTSTDVECDQRDYHTILNLISHFSTNLMDDYLSNGPEYIYDKMLESFEYWQYSIGASSFVIFNPVLKDKVMSFFNLWAELMGHGEWYAPSESGSHRYRFQGLNHDMFVNPDIERNFLHLFQVSLQTAEAYKELIEFIKTGYKLDLASLSSGFEKGSVNF